MKSSALIERARERLAWHANETTTDAGRAARDTAALKSAAVLIPLIEADDGWRLLFIRRAENDNDYYHSGQVAFPGGCAEPADTDLMATALREAFEEIGLAPEDADILGRLPYLISTTGYRIAPFVGSIPWPYRLHLDRDEVARVFTMPLVWLSNRANYEVYEHTTPNGKVPVIRYRLYDGELLWGATARMAVSLAQTLAYGDGAASRRVAMR